jgi:hypothetical protein
VSSRPAEAVEDGAALGSVCHGTEFELSAHTFDEEFHPGTDRLAGGFKLHDADCTPTSS